MALVSKLIQVGLTTRQAKALGFESEEINAAGTNQATAAAITKSFAIVNGADGNNGVRLPTYEMSDSGIHFIVNNSASFALQIYPATGEQINLAGANNYMKIGTGSHAIIYVSKLPLTGGSSWFALGGSQLTP